MHEKVKAIIEVLVGEDTAVTMYVTDLERAKNWLTVAENPRTIIDVTDALWIPAQGARWDGKEFNAFTHHGPLPDFLYFAFVVDSICVFVQRLDPRDFEDAATAAAYQSSPIFKVYYA
ncbi:hypothetical protein UFOVP225_47 [uncultured Caudovirales phage]|uniref:Uncharacterized protein n=1 Tax=uncultured Caudovirales phage TaxID=2100421 RepID=A0A6J5L6E7_9CAUD|nr:hypothetical protein UFOVP113_60 [uncultured Caudovirales phage]CAB5219262.1 hypothetical protein UFOVP225_47 [uncultured Caudovirales phage]